MDLSRTYPVSSPLYSTTYGEYKLYSFSYHHPTTITSFCGSILGGKALGITELPLSLRGKILFVSIVIFFKGRKQSPHPRDVSH